MPDIVTFDPANLLIVEIDTAADNELNADEIYSEWKDWQLAASQNMGHLPAFRVVGGDPRSPTANLGTTFFLDTWKIRPAEHSHKLTVVGNMFTEGGVGSIFVPTLGAFTVHTETVVTDLISGLAALFALVEAQGSQQLADAVKLAEVYKSLALDSTDKFTKTPTEFRSASGDIVIAITGDGETTSTGERQP